MQHIMCELTSTNVNFEFDYLQFTVKDPQPRITFLNYLTNSTKYNRLN